MIEQKKWDTRFLELAKHISTWSKDRTKVGAVIVDPITNKVVSMGYNGFPRGVIESDKRLFDREVKLKLTAHAELNAILNAACSVRHCDIYVYPTLMVPNCCPECAKAIVQSGIERVVGYAGEDLSVRWQELAEFSEAILSEGGVQYYGSIMEQNNEFTKQLA